MGYPVAMTADQLRAIMAFLQGCVQLGAADETGRCTVTFTTPTPEAMERAGLDAEGCRRVLAAEWFAEMVDEVVTTPDFCDPGEAEETVLRYARDVVAEYIRKRFVL